MVRKILSRFCDLFGSTSEEQSEMLLFCLASGMVFSWCVMIGIEAFGLGINRDVLPEVTVLMLSVLTGYTGHKGYARWGKKTLDGPHWGKTCGVLAMAFGMIIYFLNLLRPEVLVPEQLHLGLEGIIVNIFGWQVIKVAHAKTVQTNGSGEKSGTSQI